MDVPAATDCAPRSALSKAEAPALLSRRKRPAERTQRGPLWSIAPALPGCIAASRRRSLHTSTPADPAWGRGALWQHADAPATEATLLRQLASTNDQDLVEEVAANPNCPPILLERLVGGAPWERVAVAANPAFGHLRSAALLAALPSDAETSVKIAAAACPACPPEMLAVYAADDDWEVRDAAASSPACPAWLLDVLADDPNHTVALSALTR